jgi:hypothetical protein
LLRGAELLDGIVSTGNGSMPAKRRRHLWREHRLLRVAFVQYYRVKQPQAVLHKRWWRLP